MWIEYLRIALSVLYGHKFRSLLTVTSITIGAFSIVLMTSLADSGLKTLASGIEELGGSRMLSLWRKQPEAMESKQLSYTRGLTAEDAEALRNVPHLEALTAYVSLRDQAMTPDNGKRQSGDVLAGDQSLLSFFGYRIGQGRMLDQTDHDQHSAVCLIGHDLADKVFGKGEEVLGRSITTSGVRCRIVGRLARLDRWGVGFGWRWDEVLVLPLPTLEDRNRAFLNRGRQIAMRSENPRFNDIVKRILNSIILERHHGVDDFNIFDLEKRLAGFYRIFLIMKVIVGLLAGIALLVGGVGIMNIMLVSVSERVREIGVRKALGASPADIGRQFLVEAMLLSAVGGIVGVSGGIGASLLGSYIIQQFKPRWVSAISEPAVIAALSVALLIGVVFGYFPARRAGRLDAVTAIRTGN